MAQVPAASWLWSELQLAVHCIASQRALEDASGSYLYNCRETHSERGWGLRFLAVLAGVAHTCSDTGHGDF